MEPPCVQRLVSGGVYTQACSSLAITAVFNGDMSIDICDCDFCGCEATCKYKNRKTHKLEATLDAFLLEVCKY